MEKDFNVQFQIYSFRSSIYFKTTFYYLNMSENNIYDKKMGIK